MSDHHNEAELGIARREIKLHDGGGLADMKAEGSRAAYARATAGPCEAADVVYHYIDSVRLPWALAAGELRPGGWAGGERPRDYLWATRSPRVDRTSSAYSRLYRRGEAYAVRIAMPAELFVPWDEVKRSVPSGLVARLEARAEDPSLWMCRGAPVARDAWVRMEMRGHIRPREWRALPRGLAAQIFDPDIAVVEHKGLLFGSCRLPGPAGTSEYLKVEFDWRTRLRK